ncbi:hypothetical protein JCM10207_006374 [Rhodosporidiobolus poonsookiae]
MRSTFAVGAVLAAAFSTSLAAPSLPCSPGQFQAPNLSCGTTCPEATFANAATRTCKSCYATSYKTCSSAKVTGALTCITGYYLKGGRCLPQANLPAGTYGTADGQIILCGKGVAKCDETGIISCKRGYFHNDGCEPCAKGAAECTGSRQATACSTGFFLSEGICSQTCPSGSFGDSASATCKPCYSPTYLTCKNTRVTGALSCASGYYLASGGRCMAESNIPSGFYGDGSGKLIACPNGAKTCTAAGPTTCKTGYVLSADGKTCTVKPACPEHGICSGTGALLDCEAGYIPLDDNSACNPVAPCIANGVCDAATGEVYGCVKGYVLSAEKTACNALPPCPTNGVRDATTGALTGCVSGYMLNGDSTGCVVQPACPSGMTCDASGTPTACTGGLYLDVTGVCVVKTGCSAGTWPYWRGVCIPAGNCPVDSYQPYGRGTPNMCDSCDPNNRQTTCFQSIPVGCIAGFTPISSQCYGEAFKLLSVEALSLICLVSALSNLPRRNSFYSNCIDINECPADYYYDGHGCMPCTGNYRGLDDGIATCIGPGYNITATSCKPGYLLMDESSTCVESCPSTRSDQYSGRCTVNTDYAFYCLPTFEQDGHCVPTPAGAGALTIDSYGKATSCDTNYVLTADGLCECAPGMHRMLETGLCIPTCDNERGNYYSGKGCTTDGASCQGTYQDADGNCAPCGAGVLTCSGLNQDIVCDTRYSYKMADNGTCIYSPSWASQRSRLF